MALTAVTHNLTVAPYKLIELTGLKITKTINDHARLRLTGIVPEELKDSYIEQTNTQTGIEVSQTDEQSNSTTLFKGIVVNIEIKVVREIYYLEVEAVSHTYDLDIKQKSRSFQDHTMTYRELIKNVIAGYPGADTIDTASKGAAINNFTLQYRETDWEFLKRMASRFNTGLVPAATFDKPKFYFGVPDGDPWGRLEDYHYSIIKKISDYRRSSENYIQGIAENDYIYYQIETEKILEIGSQVQFKGKPLWVSEAVTQLENSIIKHQYTLTAQNGMKQNKIHNDQIVGLSLRGKVIEVARDNLKVHLEIDSGQNKAKAHWFPYATAYSAEGSSGWYCMPELNDYVNINFPGSKEEEGYAINSIRETYPGTDKINNPDIKYFRTSYGKELKFTPEEIVITGEDGQVYISLNERSGIRIYSNKNIEITTPRDIIMDAGRRITITARSQINLDCRQSKIKMDGVTVIKANEVKVN